MTITISPTLLTILGMVGAAFVVFCGFVLWLWRTLLRRGAAAAVQHQERQRDKRLLRRLESAVFGDAQNAQKPGLTWMVQRLWRISVGSDAEIDAADLAAARARLSPTTHDDGDTFAGPRATFSARAADDTGRHKPPKLPGPLDGDDSGEEEE